MLEWLLPVSTGHTVFPFDHRFDDNGDFNILFGRIFVRVYCWRI
jgi:hypothetical protein